MNKLKMMVMKRRKKMKKRRRRKMKRPHQRKKQLPNLRKELPVSQVVMQMMVVRRKFLAMEEEVTMSLMSQSRSIKEGNQLVLPRRINMAAMMKAVERSGEEQRKEEVKREERRRVKIVMTATMRSLRRRGSPLQVPKTVIQPQLNYHRSLQTL